ncbi:hypothetical protein N7G274_009896 [Stereocaulon virgatum]|uniref:Uncharacterized protein n=1 Tax=Stereocaulon virgatum TaxID=373712 RepID=A0ABR3ZXG9_9LECA
MSINLKQFSLGVEEQYTLQSNDSKETCSTLKHQNTETSNRSSVSSLLNDDNQASSDIKILYNETCPPPPKHPFIPKPAFAQPNLDSPTLHLLIDTKLIHLILQWQKYEAIQNPRHSNIKTQEPRKGQASHHRSTMTTTLPHSLPTSRLPALELSPNPPPPSGRTLPTQIRTPPSLYFPHRYPSQPSHPPVAKV